MICDLRFTIWNQALPLQGVLGFERIFRGRSYLAQSARGLAQSKTRGVFRRRDPREASWTAAALRRFSTALNQTVTQARTNSMNCD